MAAPRNFAQTTKEVYTFPSRFGSHASMIVEEHKPADPSLVILKDENGLYVTERRRLDIGMADPNRYQDLTNRNKSVKLLLG